MSIKDNVDYVKSELSSEEKFIENFVKSERFFKKYKNFIIALFVLLLVGSIGYVIKNSIAESNKLDANIALNKYLETKDENALKTLKDKNENLYNIALLLNAKKENKILEVNLPILKELSKYQVAVENKDLNELNNLSVQNDFLLKEFAIFNRALLLTNDGKFEEAKTLLKQIPQTSKVNDLANMLNHYLLTK